jgi:hypothetical protein
MGVNGCAPLMRAQPQTGVFARMMEGRASECGEEKVVMIDATYLKAHRRASGLRV